MIELAPSPAEDRTATIRKLNDAFRTRHAGGRVMVTPGVRALGLHGMRNALIAVAAFRDFGPGNDPWNEHDFGAVTVDGRQLLFKIDTYDLAFGAASPDPADPSVTMRVLTIMLPEEY